MDNFNFERLLSSKVKRRSLLLGAGALTGIAIAQAGTVTGFAVFKLNLETLQNVYIIRNQSLSRL